MGEVAFAKQFLAIVDKKPVKYSNDHVFDPRKLPAQPAYTLPRMPQQYEKAGGITSSSNDGAAAAGSLTLKLKPLSSSVEPVTLEDVSAGSSIYDVKAQVAKRTGYAPDKVKILWERRPVGDAKTLKEVAGEVSAGQSIEMGVMFVGKPTATPGAGGSSPPGSETVPAAPKSSGREALASQDFWDDLKGFVSQRTKDQALADELVHVSREAWKAKAGTSQ